MEALMGHPEIGIGLGILIAGGVFGLLIWQLRWSQRNRDGTPPKHDK